MYTITIEINDRILTWKTDEPYQQIMAKIESDPTLNKYASLRIENSVATKKKVLKK